MRTIYLQGDLFSNIENLKYPILVPHVCNNKGIMGAGFAKFVKQKYPEVFHWYKSCLTEELGTVSYVHSIFNNNICFANMIAQTLGGKRPLDYHALIHCMVDVFRFCNEEFIEHIIAPMFGSGLAGGNWDFIAELIEDYWVKKGLQVTIFYL